MRKLAIQAREFAANPPRGVRFIPAPYRIILECGVSKTRDHLEHAATKDGIPFDVMEIGDLVILCVKTTAHYQGGRKPTVSERWLPARCISAAKARVFEVMGETGVAFTWREDRATFQVWRVTYQWRQVVHKLMGREFETQGDLEAAMAQPEAERIAA